MPSLDSSLGIVFIVAIILSICVYPVPLIIAFKRGHPNRVAIAALNLLTGWTFLGWVASLVWALTSPYQPIYASPSGSIRDMRATEAVYDQAAASVRPMAVEPNGALGPPAAVPGSSRFRDMRLVVVGCISAIVVVGLILLFVFNAKPKDIVIMGLGQSKSLAIKEQIRGGFSKACHPQQIAPLDWPGGKYEAVLYSCDEPKDVRDAAPIFDEYPAHVVALRKKGLLDSAVFAVDSDNQDYSFVVGRLGERDAVFAQSETWGMHPTAITDMLIWDNSSHAPRLINVDAITSNLSVGKGIEYEGGLWPSWTAGSDEIQFKTTLLLPGDSYCCPTGGEFDVTYKTLNGGGTWKFVRAIRIAGDSTTTYDPEDGK